MSQAGIYLNSSGPLVIVETLTGNTGGPVGPTGNNINVIGSGNITVVGTPGTSTLTISEVSGSATTFNENSGSATPSAGVINVIGGTNVTTSGAGNTITINANSGAQVVNYTGITNASSPYTVLSTDYYIGANSTGGVITVRLPNSPSTGRIIIVKDKNGTSAANNITITTVGGGVTLDGATSFVMNTNYESAQFIFNGASYEVF